MKNKNIPELRFPEFAKDGEWVDEKLANYIDLFSGIALKSEELSDDESGIPILRGINITEGYIRHSKEIDKYFIGDLENLKKYLIRENDIVIGMDGSKVGKNVALIKKKEVDSNDKCTSYLFCMHWEKISFGFLNSNLFLGLLFNLFTTSITS